MAGVDALIARVTDEQVRSDLVAAVKELRKTSEFGLVFERHLPETVRLPHHPVRRGSKAALRSGADKSIVKVEAIRRQRANVRRLRSPDGSAVGHDDPSASAIEQVAVADLVAVAEFGDPVYPGLRRLGTVERGGDKHAHVVIKGENHHTLEALQFTHAGKVDCIYIDPPYNTGAKDWKYDNNYVDENDSWRHSKWLSFMERRLLLARSLLKPEGVLIVTIDEHEVHHLGVLLERVFPTCRRPMVTIVMNSAGNTQNGFYRVEEHAFFCFPPGTGPVPITDDLLADEDKKPRSLWGTHIRSGGINDRPSKRPNLVYPIAIDADSGRFHQCGASLEHRLAKGELGTMSRSTLDAWRPDPTETIDGRPVVWPFSVDGSIGTWRNDAQTFARLVGDGFVRIRPNQNAPGTNRWSISYVTKGNRKKVSDHVIPVLGNDDRDGSLLLGNERRPVIPKSVWKRRLHDATNWGSPMLRAFVGPNSFNYPKSPYAVRDTLATVVANKPDALILDFFAGSGTTLQATCMLNAADGGRRTSILVTNNEIGETDNKRLRAKGLYPGDTEWESRGVFELVTRPRCAAVVTGQRGDGSAIEGEYDDGTLYGEGFAENVEFLELTYLDAGRVELDLAFNDIAPLLWLRAGGQGPVIDECLDVAGRRKPYAWTARYGVLFNTDRWRNFIDKMPASATTVFIVTDSITTFAQVADELPRHVQPVRLYERYLTTFAINA